MWDVVGSICVKFERALLVTVTAVPLNHPYLHSLCYLPDLPKIKYPQYISYLY